MIIFKVISNFFIFIFKKNKSSFHVALFGTPCSWKFAPSLFQCKCTSIGSLRLEIRSMADNKLRNNTKIDRTNRYAHSPIRY